MPPYYCTRYSSANCRSVPSTDFPWAQVSCAWDTNHSEESCTRGRVLPLVKLWLPHKPIQTIEAEHVTVLLVKLWLPKIRFTLRMEILPQDLNPGWNLVVMSCNVNYDSWQREVRIIYSSYVRKQIIPSKRPADRT